MTPLSSNGGLDIMWRKIDPSVVVAARRRGWSAGRIATAAGITSAAVTYLIRTRAPELLSKRHAKGRSAHQRPAVHGFICEECGKFFTGKAGQDFATLAPPAFCSLRCKGMDARQIPEELISQAIEMRRGGDSWIAIGKALHRSVQAIQYRIFVALARKQMLTGVIVAGIWDPPSARWRERPPRWASVERSSGLYVDRPHTWQYPDHSQSRYRKGAKTPLDMRARS